MTIELYKTHRPTSFKQVLGQDEAVRQLVEMGKTGKIPHTLLFSGPSGCGKTTLARILRVKLGCADHDFQEINAADARGIEMVRDIRGVMGLAPINGKCRVWLIDECHQLTSQAQESLLKILEDTPAHVYFFLASTDPGKLKKTIITRSTEIKVKPLDFKSMTSLVDSVYKDEKGDQSKLGDEVMQKLVEIADGSARKSLVLLHQIIGITEEKEQLKVLESVDLKRQAIEICRLLMKGVSWKEMAALLKTVDEEPESIRWLILGYFSTVALNGNTRAIEIMSNFQFNFFDTKRAGLIMSCYNAVK